MWLHRSISVTATACLGASVGATMAREQAELKGKVDSVRSIPVVRLRLTDRNTTTEPVFVPTCQFSVGRDPGFSEVSLPRLPPGVACSRGCGRCWDRTTNPPAPRRRRSRVEMAP
jgi:hypothetical protein